MQQASSALTYLVATDGSAPSKQAFELAADSLMDPKTDKLIVTHVFDDQDNKRPNQLRFSTIKQNVQTHLVSRLHPDHYATVWRKHSPPTSKKDTIIEVATETKADLIIAGFHGRKGPKGDSTVLGTTVGHLTRNIHCPIVVVKDFLSRDKKQAKSYRWLVCSDGSEKSAVSYQQVRKIMNRETDTLIVLSIATSDLDPKKLEEDYQLRFKEDNVKGEVVIIDFKFGTKVQNHILQFVHDEKTPYIDFVGIGRFGSGFSKHSDANYIGSVAMGVLRQSKANVVLST